MLFHFTSAHRRALKQSAQRNGYPTVTPAPDLSSDQRPTLRMIAQRAGLSGSAVSMALRTHPRISAATRERVQRIARELGYRPDPDVAKLMNHLRLRHKPRFNVSLVALTTIPENEERPYNRKL